MFGKKAIFLIFCTVFVVGGAFSQDSLAKKLSAIRLKTFTNKALRINVPTTIRPIISPTFYVDNLGFFCKKELQLQKITKIPFFFRLGSLQQCNRLEGKRTNLSE